MGSLNSLGRATLNRTLNRWATAYVAGEWDARARSRLGLIPSSDVNTDDVFLVGYPGSGTTWLKILVAAIVYGVDLERTPYAVISDLIPNRSSKYYRRLARPMYFKGHYLPMLGLRRVVYLVRDGRDATLSNYHRFSLLPHRAMELRSLVQQGDPRSGTWHDHVETWLANPYDAEMLIIRYEDLKGNGIHELRRLCHFLGVEREDDVLASVYDKASFATVSAKLAREIQVGEAPGPWKRSPWRTGYDAFLRRGEVGDYRDEMPDNVTEEFMAQAAATLQRLGYLDSTVVPSSEEPAYVESAG